MTSVGRPSHHSPAEKFVRTGFDGPRSPLGRRSTRAAIRCPSPPARRQARGIPTGCDVATPAHHDVASRTGVRSINIEEAATKGAVAIQPGSALTPCRPSRRAERYGARGQAAVTSTWARGSCGQREPSRELRRRDRRDRDGPTGASRWATRPRRPSGLVRPSLPRHAGCSRHAGSLPCWRPCVHVP